MKERKLKAGSLTEKEVSIIRALLAREGFQNQEILGRLNILRKSEGREYANGGRISEVKTDKPRYKGIQAASKADLDSFLTATNQNLPAQADSYFSTATLERIFPLTKKNAAHLNITETDIIECKETFGGKHWIDNCIRAIAAFSNNRGGYIAFGLKNQNWEITGVDPKTFSNFDRKDLNQILRSTLSCGIDFNMTMIERGSKHIGLIYIPPAKIKPVIFIKQNGTAGATEGSILFRYQGENRLIGPSELHALVEERIKNLTETVLMKHLQSMFQNGIENSAIMNVETGAVEGKSGNFVIDEDLLPKLKFIKEGEFSETKGTPTLKVVGEVSSSTKVVTVAGKDLVKRYPYSWRELVAEVKKNCSAGTNDVSKAISAHGLKKNPKYSAYNFRNKRQMDAYEKLKKLPKDIPSIYNDEAIFFLIEKLNGR